MDVKYIIDSTCDIDPKIFEEPEIAGMFHIEPVTYTYKGETVPDDFGRTVSYKDFYDNMRAGGVSTTSQINVQTFYGLFEKYTKEGKTIVYIGFSSGISGTAGSAVTARSMFLESYPDADITVVDTLCVSGGYALLMTYVIDLIKAGKSKEEVVEWVIKNRLNVNHLFTVEDLVYLKRGGRVSAVSAVLGTALDIKPVLHVDELGRLIPYKKVRGRRKSLSQMTDTMAEMVLGTDQHIIISHGDCLEDARRLGDMITQRIGITDVRYSMIGGTVGSHSGPGTIALFYMGKNRDENRLV